MRGSKEDRGNREITSPFPLFPPVQFLLRYADAINQENEQIHPLEDHPDYKVASYGIDVLSKEHDKPFFLAVGLVKPHLPFICPQRFFDLYPDPVDPPRINPNDHDDIPRVGRSMAKRGDDNRFKQDDAWDEVRRLLDQHLSHIGGVEWSDNARVDRRVQPRSTVENSGHAPRSRAFVVGDAEITPFEMRTTDTHVILMAVKNCMPMPKILTNGPIWPAAQNPLPRNNVCPGISRNRKRRWSRSGLPSGAFR